MQRGILPNNIRLNPETGNPYSAEQHRETETRRTAMPAIHINKETYMRLLELAHEKRTNPEEIAEKAIKTYLALETHRIEAQAPKILPLSLQDF